ncbi:hypothetical protein C8R48DRAFT_772622 [Suillus tomentosus]|nr:hypothetical protein C8R48DRAFT_772622 [Suillus tomentosus]
MSGWPENDEQSQAVHHDNHPHHHIDYTADPLMGLPIYPDHRHDQVIHRSFLLHPGHDVAATGPDSAQGSHHVLEIAHPVPRHGIPSIFYTAWPTSQSPHPPPATHWHAEGASMHQNYPEHAGSSQQAETTVPTLSLEQSNKSSSQSSVTLEPPSSYNLDDITHHAKLSFQRGKAGPARAIFKTAKLVGMERAQLARKLQAGAPPATAQSSSLQSSEVDESVKIVPGSGTRKVLECLRGGMRTTVFDSSILPPIGSLSATVDSSWQAVADGLQGTDQDWAMEMMNDKNYVDEKMGSVIDEVSEEICGVARIFTYQCYGLDFGDMAVPVTKADIDQRANHIQGLLKDGVFLYGKLFSVDGADLGTIAFASPAIIRMARYLLCDSPHRYHRYISNGKYGPILAMAAAVCEWVLHQYETGYFVESRFLPEECIHKNTNYLKMFDNMDAEVIAILIAHLTSNSGLTRASLVTS